MGIVIDKASAVRYYIPEFAVAICCDLPGSWLGSAAKRHVVLYQINLQESTLVLSNPYSNCTFRCSFLRLATTSAAKSGMAFLMSEIL